MKIRKRNLNNLHMMAMRELKLPMLKHSRATSMKNSMTRALCFFFTGCRRTLKEMHHSAGKPSFFLQSVIF